jgi:F-type H+-transporting ATPase subunit gamma
MAGGREIKTKIKSVQNTRKVTRALEMVSASKIRKAQDRMKASRPYARLMKQVIGHIAKANSEYVHPFLVERNEIKRVGYLIVSTDRGLCGGLNSQLFRRILADMREWQGKGVEIDVVCIGQKATAFFRRLKVNMTGSVTHLGEKPQIEQLIGVIKVMLDAYAGGNLDRVFLCYNDFINTMSQKSTQDQLLPLPASESLETRHDWDYIYEPGAEVVLDDVLKRYVESLVYQAVLENLASNTPRAWWR